MWYVTEDVESEDDNTGFSEEDLHFEVPQLEPVVATCIGEPLAHKIGLDIPLGLFGTVPPPAKLPMEKVKGIVEAVAKSINAINPDAVVIYDIQDEPSRNGKERPFPFFSTHEPRLFASMLKQLAPGCDPITYRALTSGQSKASFQDWCRETTGEEYGNLRNFVLVGSRANPGEEVLSVTDASSVLLQAARGVLLGGITLPERHRDRNDEPARLIEKTSNGVSFFTSQVVYNADNVIWMLRDYADACHKQGVAPARIFLTFAPFGSARTVSFMEWLGVEVPIGSRKRALCKPTLKGRVCESMELSLVNLQRILQACKRLKLNIPLGFSVEAVSRSSIELKGAVQLYRLMHVMMNEHYSERETGERGRVLSRMLAQDATYVVQTKGGGATVTALTPDGCRPFGVIAAPKVRPLHKPDLGPTKVKKGATAKTQGAANSGERAEAEPAAKKPKTVECEPK